MQGCHSGNQSKSTQSWKLGQTKKQTVLVTVTSQTWMQTLSRTKLCKWTRLWLRSNQEKYTEQVYVLDDNSDTLLEPSANEPVLQTQIKICGDGSVMEALFTKSQTLFPMGLIELDREPDLVFRGYVGI
jgi:hypothetical protein